MHQTFTMPADDPTAFGRYHDLYAVGSTVTRLDGRFSARIQAHRLPGLLLFDRQISAAVHHRDALRVRRDGFDHFNLQVMRSGRMSAGIPGAERGLSPGDVVLFDTSKPQRTVVQQADYVAVSLPRDLVEAILPKAGRLHGTVLPRAVGEPLGDMIQLLTRHAAHLAPKVVSSSARMLASFLADLDGAASADPAPWVGPLDLRRLQGEAYIDAHLGDPRLDAAAVALGIGVSRSVLYRAFAPVGGVARSIVRRRLGVIHSALQRPGETRQVSTLASTFGFTSESHCNRAFRATYGVPPGQFRTAAPPPSPACARTAASRRSGSRISGDAAKRGPARGRAAPRHLKVKVEIWHTSTFLRTADPPSAKTPLKSNLQAPEPSSMSASKLSPSSSTSRPRMSSSHDSVSGVEA
jgi:AraC-like DNA-binding protein